MKSVTGIHKIYILVAIGVGGFIAAQTGQSAIAETPGKEIIVAPKTPEGEYLPTENSEKPEEAVLIRENTKIENLRKQIKQRENRIQKTEEEIKGINSELNIIYKKKDTLQGEIKKLTLTNKKNEAQIQVAEEAVQKGKLEIESLDSSIDNNEENLKTLHAVLKKNYRRTNEFELQGNETLLMLHTSSLFEIIKRIEETDRYSEALRKHVNLLASETEDLQENKEKAAVERSEMQRQQKELEDRRRIYNLSIANKKTLVNRTKNDETSYQKLLREKQKERLELQQEIYEYESQIEYLYDPTTVPPPKKGLLRMPFTIPVRVTQLFGETAFARANALRYGKPFHDGIDFGLPSGTKLVASADGIIVGTGNTDLVRTCQSWGKWVMIKHGFGLTTLYAHLSLIKAALGQKVKAGELIGYSGNTGFSTGPHLHLGVYDSKGIRVVPYEEVSRGTRCRGLLVPVAAQDARINPEKYLHLP